MGKNKDYVPNEIDKVQEGYDMKDETEKKKARSRKEARQEKEKRYLEDVEDIHKRYGYKVVEPELINKGFNIVHPFNCVKCGIVKAFPYDFLTTNKQDNGKNHCSQCMSINTKKVKECVAKNKIECECGMTYYATELNTCKHQISKAHINAVSQMKIKGLNKICKIQEMRKIAQANKIYNYYSLKMEEIIAELLKIEVVIIPDEFK